MAVTALSCRDESPPPSQPTAIKLPEGTVDKPEFFRKNVETAVAGKFLTVQSGGLPDHETGDFPNQHNSSEILDRRCFHMLPLVPVPAKVPIPVTPGKIGIMVNGIIFKGPQADESWNSAGKWFQNVVESDASLDKAGGHPNGRGEYHYHFYPAPLDNQDAKRHSSLIGFAFDGYPIYGPRGYTDPKDPTSKVKRMRSSYRLASARAADGPPVDPQHPLGMYVKDFQYVPAGKAGHGDLDECNGRFAVTPEFPQGIYHYHASVAENGKPAFPYFLWLFHGTPVMMDLERPPKIPGKH